MEQPYLASYSYDNAFNEQLERLKRMQDDIDKKNMQEREDTTNLIQEMLSSSKLMSMGLNFGSGTKPQAGGLYNVKELNPIRHESSFMKVGNRS